nr:ribonuclease H-like domain-containing protein [Tanacetum cinerariifolium]
MELDEFIKSCVETLVPNTRSITLFALWFEMKELEAAFFFWMKPILQNKVYKMNINRYVVPTGRVLVPTGSGTHLIKDYDFYEKQIANKTMGTRVGPMHYRNKVNHPNQFVPQVVLLRTGKATIPPARPQPVPTGKPKGNPFSDVEDKGIFDSGCSRSMTGNKERLDDFQEFQGAKVTFGGGEDFECLMLSKDFKLSDESMMVLRVPRKHNLYTINLNNLCPRGNLACLVAHAPVDESVKWHRRMGHLNYKNMNKLTKGSLVRGLPTKLFQNDHTCVACCKEFKNALMIELCGSKGIKREYSNARTLQQNGVAERKNKTFIEAARTMLAESKLPTMFWTEAVRTACYILNRVSTPYALLTGNIPSVSHFKPFGCHVTILNTSDHLGKFNGKIDEGYIVGYSASNKAYKVYDAVKLLRLQIRI